MTRSRLLLLSPVVPFLAVVVAATPARAAGLSASLAPLGWLVGTWACTEPARGPLADAFERTYRAGDDGTTIAFIEEDEGTVDEGSLTYDPREHGVVATVAMHDAAGFRADQTLALADVETSRFALQGVAKIHRIDGTDEEMRVQREFALDGGTLAETDSIWSDDAWDPSRRTYCTPA